MASVSVVGGVPPEVPADHPFPDRRQAGVELAVRLERLRHEAPIIVALEPGGVAVAHVVAEELAAPFGAIAVARIGPPGRRVGAVAEGGPAIVDHDLARAFGLDAGALAAARETAEATVADRLARRSTPLPDVTGRTVVLVGDGLATGRAAVAANRAMRRRGAARVVAAAPVATALAFARLADEVDEVVCVRCTPLPASLNEWYDQPLPELDPQAANPRAGGAVVRDQDGELAVPEAARGLIILVPPVLDKVADVLADAGFATLRLAETPRAAEALTATIEGARHRPQARRLAIGCFASGDAAPAVLCAGANLGAIVLAGGHGDPSRDWPSAPIAPTLLISAGEDAAQQQWARAIHSRLADSEARVMAVAGATHGFSQPGALEQVAHLTSGWFAAHLPPPQAGLG